MVEIQSKEVIDQISDDLKVQPALQIPRKLGNQIDLSYNVNPLPDMQVRSAAFADSTSGTIHTAHATKETWVVGGILTVSKDAANDAIQSELEITPHNSGQKELIIMRYEPSTAASNLNQVVILPYPIKVKKSSVIQITNNTATASIDTSGVVFFYETDPQ